MRDIHYVNKDGIVKYVWVDDPKINFTLIYYDGGVVRQVMGKKSLNWIREHPL